MPFFEPSQQEQPKSTGTYFDPEDNPLGLNGDKEKSSWDKRADGTEKGSGFLGVLKRPDGKFSSEISIGVNINGKETEIPTMVPTLSSDEIKYLLGNPTDKKGLFDTPIGESIRQKAVTHAGDRIKQGKSPFYDDKQELPELSWRQGKPKSPLERLKSFVGIGPEKIDPTEATAALVNAKMLNVRPSDAYRNRKTIKQELLRKDEGNEKTSIQRGFESSIVGMLKSQKASARTKEEEDNLSFTERTGEMVGKMAGDLPALLGFGLLAPVESAAAVGMSGLAGLYGLNKLLVDTYTKGALKGGPIDNPHDFFERTAGVVKEALKGALTAGAGAGAGSAVGIVSKNAAVKLLSEYTAFTMSASALEGHLPTLQELTDNAMLFGGMHLAGKVVPEIKEAAHNQLQSMFVRNGLHPDDVLQEVNYRLPEDKESTPEEVLAAIRNIRKDVQEKTSLRPAVMVDGEIKYGRVGWTHDDVLKENEISPDAEHERGFVKSESEAPTPSPDDFMTRNEAKDHIKEVEPETWSDWVAANGKGEKGELHSQDYNRAAEIQSELESIVAPETIESTKTPDIPEQESGKTVLEIEVPGQEEGRFSALKKSEPEKKRTIGDVLKDVKDSIGERGAVGDHEATEKQKAARERIKKDVKRLMAAAKEAGKSFEDYLRDEGIPEDGIAEMLKFAGSQFNEQEKEPEPIFNVKPGPDTPKQRDLADAWEGFKDGWIGDKDVAKVKAQSEAQLNKQELLKAMGIKNPFTAVEIIRGSGKERQAVRDMEAAIQIHIDLKRDPGAVERTADRLTEGQKRILNLAQNLPKEMMPLVNKIQAAYKEIAGVEYDAGLVKNFLDNFVNRIWDYKGRWSDETISKLPKFIQKKFETRTRHAKQRQFETILDGWAEGFNLKVDGAIDSLRAMREEIARTVANRNLMEAANQATDIDGDRLFATNSDIARASRKAKAALKEANETGDPEAAKEASDRLNKLEKYIQIENRGFKRWQWAGKIDAAANERVTESVKVLKEVISDLSKSSDKSPAGKVEERVKEALTSRGWSDSEAQQMINRIKESPGEGKDKLIERTIEKTIQKEVDTELNIKNYSHDHFIDEEGNIYENRPLFAPRDIATNINNMLGHSALSQVPGIDTITKYNAMFKSFILQTSLFHPRAFVNNYYLGTSGKTWKEMNIRQAYKGGLEKLKQEDPVAMLLVHEGLTVNLHQDWEPELAEEKTIFGKIVDKIPVANHVKDALFELKDLQSKWLFESFGTGLKVTSGILEINRLKKLNPNLDDKTIARQAASATNMNYGGLHLERMGRNPTLQHIFRLSCFASDWTESNIQLVARALASAKPGSSQELEVYQHLVAHWYIRSIGMMALGNFLMAGGDLDKMVDNYKQAWKDGNFKWMQINITPIYKMFGGDKDSRKYYSQTGHMLDELKVAAGLPIPFKFVRDKASVIPKDLFDGLTGRDWQGKSYTTFQELYAHGKTTKWQMSSHPVDWSTFPSYVISKTVGVQPIQVQNLMGWVTGEMDGFDALTNSLGLGVTSTHPKKGK